MVRAVDVDVFVAGDEDGRLVVDNDEWLEAKLGEPDNDLTKDLRDWASTCNGGWPADRPTSITWALERFGDVGGPGDEDDGPVPFTSVNETTLLEDPLHGYALRAPIDGADRIVVIVNDDAVYVAPPNWDWLEVTRWSQARGLCARGHEFAVDGACYLHSYTSQTTYELTDLCRTCEADDGSEAGYVACPDCPDNALLSRISFQA